MKLNRALVLRKLSRLEMEKLFYPGVSDSLFESIITKKGKDYQTLIKHDKLNRTFLEKLLKHFEELKIETKVITRFEYTRSNIDWSDAVFPVGGDGTYLLAASFVKDRKKPVIGFNSDPCRSEGHLCLPKLFSYDIKSALSKIKEGAFQWMFRTRIRVTLCGTDIHQPPNELHQAGLTGIVVDKFAIERRSHFAECDTGIDRIQLPVLALNEVFLGEIVSAKVSYFEMKLNGDKCVSKVKSSGLCVCTGTGSTSWNMSINRLSTQVIQNILGLYSSHTGQEVDYGTVKIIKEEFNRRFRFHPEDVRMNYTIRDLISAGVWPDPKGSITPRGFVNKLEIKSRCTDAGLVIDGGVSFPFNDGTVAILETYPDDALRTVQLL